MLFYKGYVISSIKVEANISHSLAYTGYTQLVERAGSILQTNERLDVSRIIEYMLQDIDRRLTVLPRQLKYSTNFLRSKKKRNLLVLWRQALQLSAFYIRSDCATFLQRSCCGSSTFSLSITKKRR